jgi:hypothetical protein
MKLRDAVKQPLRLICEETLVESMQRHCSFYKAQNGKWYMELAPHEYGEYEDATTYGPFYTEEGAMKYLNNFSNPGGYDIDDSGEREVPTVSPNGDPIRSPSGGGSRYGGFRF